MNNICYIFGAGQISDIMQMSIVPDSGDCVIAADGGFAYLQDLGVKADIVLGDFDSIEEIPQHPNLVVHPKEKDDTDMMLAVQEGLDRGYRRFIILGGMGGRLDHTYANIQVLAFIAGQGGRGFLYGEDMAVTVVENGEMHFGHEKEGIISVFAACDTAKGVTLTGLKYELSDARLTRSRPLGISNEFIGMESDVSVAEGSIVIMWNETLDGIKEWIKDAPDQEGYK
ncbi:thiamine diphosphokinase [Parasporobacterium paucivorans]|uniref:Thiamine diphosphokinase n=1 Tax=Parasporobacterium paucivorans DSM 15970 TaxID=1122934 RepID=A0A1M6J1F2_9FIRM|nr:thiamine diphosphokinase [Parasporobacterium paucivorans]SHJ40462.1 thiamine pyrophosphokinase [Parasporobacterium paucivorans DSM 15970]